MKHLFCLVVHNTWSWTPSFFESFRSVFPTEELIVVDNNLMEGQICQGKGYCYGVPVFHPRMIRESEFLQDRTDIILIEPPHRNRRPIVQARLIAHGIGIDTAVNWGLENNFDAITLLEPDCTIYGRCWIESTFDNLGKDCYATAIHKKFTRMYPPIGASFLLQEIRSSFEIQPIIKTPLQQKLAHFQFEEGNIFNDLWDTGEKVFYDFELDNKVKIIVDQGLKHHARGSIRTKEENPEKEESHTLLLL